MVQDAASPTLGQRILRSPLGPLFSRLSSERFFRQQFGSIFSPEHPLTDEEAEDQWALIRAGGGRTLNHKTIRYMEERFLTPIAGRGRSGRSPLGGLGDARSGGDRAVLDAVLGLRPSAPVTRFEDLGHYPQIEDPERSRGPPGARWTPESPSTTSGTGAILARSARTLVIESRRCGLIFRRIAGISTAIKTTKQKNRESWRARH